MKKIAYLSLIVLFVSFLGSCEKGMPEQIEGTINPGDEVDGMLFTTIDEIDWNISLSFLCDFESVEETDTSATVPCSTSPGGHIFFGNFNGAPYDNPEEADDLWKKVEADVIFDGQTINLPAFGFMEVELYGMEWKYARIWNLMVENVMPGIHTIQTMWEDQEETTKYTYVFTISDQPEAFPMLSASPPNRLNPYTSEKANLNYLLYIPDEYGENPERKWPLLIYLHGGDRVNTGVEVLKNDYPLNTLDEQNNFPFIVVAPKTSGKWEFWATDEMVNAIITLLDEVQGVLSVDPNRIYLTGGSAGGNGTWSIGVRHPERFAALAPMMGYYGWPPTVPENICDLANVPVWAFHGAEDDIIPLEAEQKLVDALKACGGDVQFTVFPDVGHNLESELVYTPELYEWLLEQTLK